MIEVKREEVEAVKMSVRRLEYQDISAKQTLEKSIVFLMDYYTKWRDSGYLLAALIRLQAYLELGFCYNDNADEFDGLLGKLGTNREIQFPQKYYAKRVALTRTQVNGLIERWSASPHRTMSRPEMVEDIILKVNLKMIGMYEYHSNANPIGKGVDYVYVLIVDEQESYLYDVRNDRYYTFYKV